MDFVVAVVLGILQGLTEWLPVSSSGHLVMGQELFGVENPILFDTVLHLGTMTSVLLFMRKRIATIAGATFKAMRGEVRLADSPDATFGWHVILATLPIIFLGLLLESYVVGSFESIPFVAMALVITGAVLLFTAHMRGKARDPSNRTALTIGFTQAFALFPGISRSGMTISGGLYSGLTRQHAVEFSFLMAVPAILAAGLFQLVRSVDGDAHIDPVPTIAGFLTALTVGYLTLKVLYRIVLADRFHYFAYYCFGMAAVLWVSILFF